MHMNVMKKRPSKHPIKKVLTSLYLKSTNKKAAQIRETMITTKFGIIKRKNDKKNTIKSINECIS